MKTRTFFLVIGFCLSISMCNAQISFMGFEQEQCGLLSNHGYTYDNIPFMCGSHSKGYKIYLDGAETFEKCIEFGGCSVVEMMFISQTTGFVVESNPNGHAVYKTNDSGVSWTIIGAGAPTYLGFYLVNTNTGYLITTWDSPLNLYIARVSDVNPHYFTDSIINQSMIYSDTIFGPGFCEIDTLEFKISNAGNVIDYKVGFVQKPFGIQQLSNHSTIQFYPNPCSDFIQFSEINSTGLIDFEIMDATGVNLMQGEIEGHQIDLSQLANGIYFIRLTVNHQGFSGKILKIDNR